MRTIKLLSGPVAAMIFALALAACGKQGPDIAACERGRINFKRYYEENPKRVDEIASQVLGDKAGEVIAADMGDLEARKQMLKMIEAMLKEVKLPAECAEYYLEVGVPASKESVPQPGAEGAGPEAGAVTPSPSPASAPVGAPASAAAPTSSAPSPANPR